MSTKSAAGPLSDPLIVAVDVGTSAIKAVVFDPGGQGQAEAGEPVATLREDERSEQDMLTVWAAVRSAITRAVQGLQPRVAAITVTAQGDGCWLVDRSGRPSRPAVLWNDGRAGTIVEQWTTEPRFAEAFRINGSAAFPGLPNAILTALVAAEPYAIEASDKALTCGGWIHLQLTGRAVADFSDAAAPWLNIHSLGYSQRLLELYDLTWAADLRPALVDSERTGSLSASAARALGLPQGLPVVLAPYDVAATAIGAGATEPGQCAVTLGTTLCTEVVIDHPDTDGPPSGLTVPSGVDRRLLRIFASMAGGDALDWMTAVLGLESAQEFERLAFRAPRGASGLRLLPYLSPAGERAPFVEPNARGVFSGLSLAHGREHLARATFEGLTFVIADCLAAVPAKPYELRVSGGGATSDAWCQVIADATQTPVIRMDGQMAARGAFLVATVELGWNASVAEAAATAPARSTRFDPDGRWSELYEAIHAQIRADRAVAMERWRDAPTVSGVR